MWENAVLGAWGIGIGAGLQGWSGHVLSRGYMVWLIFPLTSGRCFQVPFRFPERLSRQSSRATIDGESAGEGLFYPPPPPTQPPSVTAFPKNNTRRRRGIRQGRQVTRSSNMQNVLLFSRLKPLKRVCESRTRGQLVGSRIFGIAQMQNFCICGDKEVFLN